MVCQQLQHWLQAAHRLVEEWDTPEMVAKRAGKQEIQLYQVFHSLSGERILVEANSIDAARLRAGLAVGLTAQQARREMIAYRLPKMVETA